MDAIGSLSEVIPDSVKGRKAAGFQSFSGDLLAIKTFIEGRCGNEL